VRSGPRAAPPRIAVLADDLIWATRLVDGVRRAGGEPVPVRSAVALDGVLGTVTGCIVDLTARAYDPLACLGAAAGTGVPAIAVGQHDAETRRAALTAGAALVHAYRTLFEHGDRELGAWVGGLAARTEETATSGHGIPAERYAERLAAARREAAAAGLDALLVGVGADLRYLAGYQALPLERLTLLVVPSTSGSPMTLVAPRLEATPARTCPAAAAGAVEVATWEETEDPMALVSARLGEALGVDAADVRAVAVSDGLRAAFVLGLQRVLPGARFSLASGVLRTLRMRKDADEVALLRAAAQAADRVVAAVAAGPLVGRTEGDVARDVRERLVAEGHERAEFWIVASGPNSASPHHDPGERVIAAGEPIIIDIGGVLGGYGSDITRTVWVTGGDPAMGPDADFLRLYGVLQGAQAEATRAVRPGVPCERIDGVARGIIDDAGFGPYFFHRTGHGIGLEGHEEPYLVAGSAEPLAPGMAFSVEPGIYLESRYGARIEDIVVCGEAGPVILNELSRDLLVVAG